MKFKKEWYMISTISGKEEKVVDSLQKKIESNNMKEFFEDFHIFWIPYISPNELIKKAQKIPFKTQKINLYKGYIFIKMLMTDEAWFLVRNTEYVTGLVGSSGKGTKPTPISEREFKKMLERQKKLKKEFDSVDYKNPFQVGVKVKIKEGSFKNEIGIISETNFDHLTAIVEIQTFGRKVPTEFPYSTLEIFEE